MGPSHQSALSGSVPLNAICPYFTMFPLDFPFKVLGRATGGDAVLDPFCGRGTTNLAARLHGLPTVGIDAHPVAAAVTDAKLTTTSPEAITACLDEILETGSRCAPPEGPFWELAYHKATLADMARVRNALLEGPTTPARTSLRAILLGALHGPLTKTTPSYLSNQCPRTYAPKPRYAVNYWTRHGLRPPEADIRHIVARRATRQYGQTLPAAADSKAVLGDSRDPAVFGRLGHRGFGWVITSPPYYGMRTYGPDQWLRLWFLGGPPHVDYSPCDQVAHSSPEHFTDQLRQVWKNCASVSRPGARLVVRFGGFPNCRLEPVELLKESLRETGWRTQTRCDVGSVPAGRRQADHFGARSTPRREFDLWAIHSA